jgi:hypothetical protein
MFTPAPRVQVPSAAAKGEVFQVRTLISHQMETGLRHDDRGNVIPRKIINKFVCRTTTRVFASIHGLSPPTLTSNSPARDGECPEFVGRRRRLRLHTTSWSRDDCAATDVHCASGAGGRAAA